MGTCTLIIKDEVNIKFVGLPVEVRRKLVTEFKYFKPYARHIPSVKLGRWDGSVTFFGIGGDGFLSQLPRILPILERYDIEITSITDLRKPLDITFPEVKEDFWGDKCWPDGHPMAGQPIRIREHQLDALNLYAQNPQSIQSLPTSSGKTIISSTLAKMCEPYGRTVTIVPSKSLVEQTNEDFVNCGLDVGLYYGDLKELDKTHTICTWQAVSVLIKKAKKGDVPDDAIRLAQFLDGVSAVIVDECHGLKAEELKSLLLNYLNKTPIRWAMTGTIPKEVYDAECLYNSVGPLVNQLTAKSLQDAGILSTCNINVMQYIDIKQFKSYADEIKYLVTNKPRIVHMASMIQSIGESGNTLVLVSRIDTGEMLAELIPGAVFISGTVKTKDRKEEYDAFKTENCKVLIATSGVAAVGINIISLYNLVMVEPGKSFVRVIQSIGRGLRKGFEKDHVEIWDITSTCKYSKKHLAERKKYYKEMQYKYSITKVDWEK
jgi:superfamily II DNA or RNA helicase